MLASETLVRGGVFQKACRAHEVGALDEDESDDKTFKYELVSSVGGEKKDWRGGGAGEATEMVHARAGLLPGRHDA